MGISGIRGVDEGSRLGRLLQGWRQRILQLFASGGLWGRGEGRNGAQVSWLTCGGDVGVILR